jgi:hypothetical protein
MTAPLNPAVVMPRPGVRANVRLLLAGNPAINPAGEIPLNGVVRFVLKAGVVWLEFLVIENVPFVPGVPFLVIDSLKVAVEPPLVVGITLRVIDSLKLLLEVPPVAGMLLRLIDSLKVLVKPPLAVGIRLRVIDSLKLLLEVPPVAGILLRLIDSLKVLVKPPLALGMTLRLIVALKFPGMVPRKPGIMPRPKPPRKPPPLWAYRQAGFAAVQIMAKTQIPGLMSRCNTVGVLSERAFPVRVLRRMPGFPRIAPTTPCSVKAMSVPPSGVGRSPAPNLLI